MTVPMYLLASKDEDPEAVKGFMEQLTVPKATDTYADQVHGFMAARGDLSNENVRVAFENGYKAVLDFL